MYLVLRGMALRWFYNYAQRAWPSQCWSVRERVELRTLSIQLVNALLDACRWCVWHSHYSCPNQLWTKEGERRSSAFLGARSDLEQGRRRLLNGHMVVGIDFEQEKSLPDPQNKEERDSSRSRTRWPYSFTSQRLIMISVIFLIFIGTFLFSS